MTRPEKPTIAAFHGAWLGGWCFDALSTTLQDFGYPFLALDLPIDQPDFDYDDYADFGAALLQNEPEVILLGHSMSGNVIARAAHRLQTQGVKVRHLFYVAAGLDDSTIAALPTISPQNLPPRFSAEFDLIRNLPLPDADHHRQLFFSDEIPAAIQKTAFDHFRPQYRVEVQPPLQQWYGPDTANTSIYFSDDRIIRGDFSQAFSRQVLATRPVVLPGGHCDFIVDPAALASVIVRALEIPSNQ